MRQIKVALRLSCALADYAAKQLACTRGIPLLPGWLSCCIMLPSASIDRARWRSCCGLLLCQIYHLLPWNFCMLVLWQGCFHGRNMKRIKGIPLKLVQRLNIYFCVKLGWALDDTRNALQLVYGQQRLSCSRINFWYKEFKDGRTDLVDLHRNARARSGRSAQNIQTVRNLINADCRTTIAAIQNASGIPNTTIHRIIRKDLNLKLKCARFVPHTLTPRHLRERLEISQAMLQAIQINPGLLRRVITTDETWVHQYNPETKRQSSEWLAPGEQRAVKPRKALSTQKCMLITLFDYRGMVHFEFVRNRTVNTEIFVQILGCLKTALVNKMPRNRRPVIHMDNASPHDSRNTRAQLLFTGIWSIHHPALSPDLAPSDFWLFPRLKQGLKGRHFQNLDALEAAVGQEIGNIPVQEYNDCIICCKVNELTVDNEFLATTLVLQNLQGFPCLD